MNAFIMQEPLWLQAWIMLMVVVNVGAIVFVIGDVRARWVALAFAGSFVTMNLLFEQFGYTRILGLAHVIFWTPLVIYLWRVRDRYPEKIWSTRWMWAVMVINSLSLIIDYIDVVRFLLGDGALS